MLHIESLIKRSRLGGITGLRMARNIQYFLFVFLLALPIHKAEAQAIDPFSASSGPKQWRSLDEYDTGADDEDKKVTEADQSTSAAQPAAPGVTPVQPQAAAPSRPINFPSMPSGGAIVSSTEDEKEKIPVASEEKKWSEVEAAHEEFERQAKAKALLSQKNKDPFKVRYATLPDASIKAVSAERVSRPKSEREASAKALALKASTKPEEKKEEDKAKTKVTKEESTEACKAFADYRRRQLDALESDRQTLAELKNALSELGLTDKLSFMTNRSSSLGAAEAGQTAAQGAPPKVP